MITTRDIEQLSVASLQQPDEVTRTIDEILVTTEEDDRDWLLYNFAEKLLVENLLDEAERVARLMDWWLSERTWFFGIIASKLWKLGQRARALCLLEEAIPIARLSGIEWQQAESLTKLAQHFIEVDQKERAVNLLSEAAEIAQAGERQCEIIGNCQDAWDSASVLSEVAWTFAGIGEISEAKKVANSILNNHKRCRVLERLNAA